jgi:DNA-binding NtrC family response regulator
MAARKVLIVVEDRVLSDLMSEALAEAGHAVAQADGAAAARSAVSDGEFDAAIIDLDTRAREGVALITELRATHPLLTVIALLPCGGLPNGARQPLFHVALEKPARLAAVVAAVSAGHAAIRN